MFILQNGHSIKNECTFWKPIALPVHMFIFMWWSLSGFAADDNEGRLPRNVFLHPLLCEFPIISCWLNSLCSNTLGCKPRQTHTTHTFHCMCHQLQGKRKQRTLFTLQCARNTTPWALWMILLPFFELSAFHCLSHSS